jgi:hypothetical protein
VSVSAIRLRLIDDDDAPGGNANAAGKRSRTLGKIEAY